MITKLHTKRRDGDAIRISGPSIVRVLETHEGSVRLSIEADRSVEIHCEEHSQQKPMRMEDLPC